MDGDQVPVHQKVVAPPGATLAQLRERFPGREVYPDTTEHLRALPSPPSDPLYPQQWALQAPPAVPGGAGLAGAWPLATGRGVVVAVVDTGLRAESGEFTGRVLPGWDFISSPESAGDGDGRDPDYSDTGDYGDFEPSSWHGTHVAGSAVAGANNGGMVGVAPEASLLPVRALGRAGGLLSDILDAVVWASGGRVAGVPDNPTPARVINLSLGSQASCGAYQTAIDLATSRGAVVVTAAGNDAVDAAGARPGNCRNVVNVGAVAAQGVRASYSNYGPDVLLSAPGGDLSYLDSGILSVVDSGASSPTGLPTYGANNGTSMAAPHVSGAVALALERNPALTTAEIADLLTRTASPVTPTSAALFTCAPPTTCGAGVLNASAFVQAVPVLPAPPTALAATATATSLQVTWTPGADGGTPLLDHVVEYSADGVRWAAVPHPPSPVASLTLPGLSPAMTYQVRVAAVNKVGRSEFTAPIAATTLATVPSAPAALARRAVTPTSVTVSWAAPYDGGSAVIDHMAQVSAGRGWAAVRHRPSSDTTATVSGLRPRTAYRLRVALVNAVGAGAYSPVLTVRTPWATRLSSTRVTPRGPVRRGTRVTVSTKLGYVDGRSLRPVRRAALTLVFDPVGRPKPRVVATLRTTRKGSASVAWRVPGSGTLRLVYAGAGAYAAVISGPLAVRARR
nr:S8 family serine peptidase [Motilibacter aurantiacus]